MTGTEISPKRLVDDSVMTLQAVFDAHKSDDQPYAIDIRQAVEAQVVLRFEQYVHFLERYGFLILERKTDLLTLTQAGKAVLTGDDVRMSALTADSQYHFVDQVETSERAESISAGVEIDSRYRRLECIGSGSLGRVWSGRQMSTNRDVAIKMFVGLDMLHRGTQPQSIRRQLELIIRRQARVLSPFVVPVLDQNTGYDEPYIVMGLAKGGNLRQLMDRGPLAPELAVRYLFQIVLGLKAAHQVGLIHRDLKPENILLDEKGNVMLSDFGLTRLADSQGTMLRRAYVGYGSLGYMAPETFRQTIAPTPANDIYAVGILLYEMLVGSLPGRRSAMPSEVVDDVPKDVDAIFDKMTRDNLQERFSRIDEVLEAFWASESVCNMLDSRSGPVFFEPPTELPGLAVEQEPIDSELSSAPLEKAPSETIKETHSPDSKSQIEAETPTSSEASSEADEIVEASVPVAVAAPVVPMQTVDVHDDDVLEEKEVLAPNPVKRSAESNPELSVDETVGEPEKVETAVVAKSSKTESSKAKTAKRTRPQPRPRAARDRTTRPKVTPRSVERKPSTPEASDVSSMPLHTLSDDNPLDDAHTGTMNSVADADITSTSSPQALSDADSTRLLEAAELPDSGASKPAKKAARPAAALPRVVGPRKTKKTKPKNDEPPSVVVDESLYDFEPTSGSPVGDDLDSDPKTAVHKLRDS